MATYRIYIAGIGNYFVECDSMLEAMKMASALVNDNRELDRVEEKDGTITYYNYFIEITIKKCHNRHITHYDCPIEGTMKECPDGGGDEECEIDDGENFTRKRFVHSTPPPRECPFCGTEDWHWEERCGDGSIITDISTCRKCGVERYKKICHGCLIRTMYRQPSRL